ncbi:MAG: hypothetical protein ACM3PT_00725 [Deltaproteobacteria bacterium]
MRLLIRFFLISSVFFLLKNYTFSQETSSLVDPKIFYIGQNEKEYSQIIKNYPESLLTVSKDSIDLAYLNWMYVLQDIEVFARKEKFDLNGLKIWLNVFWNKNGKIDAISFYPKPNSRNMEFENLVSFFKEFARQYNPRLKYKANFSHFGSAKFPSFAEMYINQK